MTNPEVDAAIAELVRLFKLYGRWLTPTPYDWSDAHLRAHAALSIGGLRWLFRFRSSQGPARNVLIELRPEEEANLPPDERELILARLAEPKRLPRRRGGHQEGKYGPRNVAIRMGVKMALARGFKLTRNPEPAKGRKVESACSLVRIALARVGVKLSEASILDIHLQRPPRRRRGMG